VAKAELEEISALAEEKDAPFFKAAGRTVLGIRFGLTGDPIEAVRLIASSIAPYRATGAKILIPHILSQLARAYAHLGQFDDAWRFIDEAMTTAEASLEQWSDAETHGIAGEIALLSRERDFAKAEAHFERALEIARAQQARSWELRAAMRLARLWRDSGRRTQVRDLLAPIYGWFTEGFDTADLKEAKALLEQLA
jgi:predicted ATPase